MLLGGAEHALGRQGQQGPGAEEVVEQLLGAQPGPHPVQGLGHLGQAPDLPGEFSQVEAALLVGELIARRPAVAAGRGDRGRGRCRVGPFPWPLPL